ncbi:MAG TPA: haloacid dehalogenase type II [Burkholderiaceae bacterium]|nr:haloacid dehalogenase type II [Burkholderiaceae bacterium]HMX11394.1 haloacid dehalogenase type II [Burkholderiaceae bacterium]HMY99329.1 haloacid dehalogenase type II [Burkholderiaceae bacterium]HNB44199.1 haloacid dehalogenase type II [Burkholderiaceae bacterium]HNG80250.1 haloacid dehalogenase type II [Burkholderiaceae bacterium]
MDKTQAARTAHAGPAAPGAAAPRAVLFDAYGTLFDVYSVALTAEQLFPRQGEALALLWRDKQIEYTRLLTMSAPDGSRYRPFWDLTRDALRFACARLQLPLGADAELRLMNQYRALSAFPEVREVLQTLRERGVTTGILSNGDPAMLDVAVKSAGIGALLDPVLSVEPARAFKTDPRAYALGPAALGLPAKQILFVSSNGWDAIGATWYGFSTLWVNRTGQPLEQLGTEPTRIGASLRDVLALCRPEPVAA